MNRSLIALLTLGLFLGASSAFADEITPDQFRRLVIADRKEQFATGDSIGVPIRVIQYGEKPGQYLIAPVIRDGKVIAVYRDDPRRNSVCEVSSETNSRTLKSALFTTEGARHAMEELGVTDPAPKLVSVGPISFLGATNAVWYHDTGESFVLLSLSGKLVTETDIARFSPKHLDDLRKIGQ